MIDIVEEKVCPVCHKKFYIRCECEEYGWRIGEALYCSYTCMRKIEKMMFPPVVERKLRKMPEDLLNIWNDMVELRGYSRKYDRLRRMKYSERLDDAAKSRLPDLIAECNRRIERLKIKYAYGISKLSKENYFLIYGFAICGWDSERLQKESGLSYDEVCDKFEEILRSLKRFVSVEIYRRRWICG